MASVSTPPPPPPQKPTPPSPPTPSSSVASFVQHFENSSPTASQTLTSHPHSSKPIAPTVQHFELQTQTLTAQSFDSESHTTTTIPTFHNDEMPSESPVSTQNVSGSLPAALGALQTTEHPAPSNLPVSANAASITHHDEYNTVAPVVGMLDKSGGDDLAGEKLRDTATPAIREDKIGTHASPLLVKEGEELVSETQTDAKANECYDGPSVADRSNELLMGEGPEEVETVQTSVPDMQMFDRPHLSHEEKEEGGASEHVLGMVAPVVEMFENPPTLAEEKREVPIAGAVAPVVEMFDNSSVTGEDEELDRAAEDEGGNEGGKVAPVVGMFENPVRLDEEKSEGAAAETVAPVVSLFEKTSIAAEERTEASGAVGGAVLPVVELFENMPAAVDDADEKNEMATAGAVAPVVNMFENSSLAAEEEEVRGPVAAVGTMAPAVEMFENSSSDVDEKRQASTCGTAVPVFDMFENASMSLGDKERIDGSFEVAGAVVPVAEMSENATREEGKKIETTLSVTVAPDSNEDPPLMEGGVRFGRTMDRPEDRPVAPVVDALESQQREAEGGLVSGDGAEASGVSIGENRSMTKGETGELEESSTLEGRPLTPVVGVISDTHGTEREESKVVVAGAMNPVAENSSNALDRHEHGDVEMPGRMSPDLDVSKNLLVHEDLQSDVATTKAVSSEGDSIRISKTNEASGGVAVQGVLASGEELLESKLNEKENSAKIAALATTAADKKLLDDKSTPRMVENMVENAVDAVGGPLNPGGEAEPSAVDETRNAEVDAAFPDATYGVPEILSSPEEFEERNVMKEPGSSVVHDFDAPQDTGLLGHDIQQPDLVAPVVDTIDVMPTDSELQAFETDKTHSDEPVVQTNLGYTSTDEHAAELQSTEFATARNISSSAETSQTEKADSRAGSILQSGGSTGRGTANDTFVEDALGKSADGPEIVKLNAGTEYKDLAHPAGKAEQVEISRATDEDQNSGDQYGTDLKNVCIGSNAIGAEIFAESSISRGTTNGGGKDLPAADLPNHNFSTADESDSMVGETPAESKPAAVESAKHQVAVSSDSPDRPLHPRTLAPETVTAMPAIARSAELPGLQPAAADDKLLGFASPEVGEPSIVDIARAESEKDGSTTVVHPSNEHEASVIGQAVTSDNAAPADGVSSGFEDLLAEAESLAVAGLSEDLKEFKTEITDFDESIPIVSGLGIDANIREAGISSEEARLLQALNAEIARMELSGRSVDEIQALSATEEEMYSTTRAPEVSATTEGDGSLEENKTTPDTEAGSSGDVSAGEQTAVPHMLPAEEDLGKSVPCGTTHEREDHLATKNSTAESKEVIDGPGTLTVPDCESDDSKNDSKNNEDAVRDVNLGGRTTFNAVSTQIAPNVESREGLVQTQTPARAHEGPVSETSLTPVDEGQAKGNEDHCVNTPETHRVQKSIDSTDGAADEIGCISKSDESDMDSSEGRKGGSVSESATEDAHVGVSPSGTGHPSRAPPERENSAERPHKPTSGNLSIEERLVGEKQGGNDKPLSESKESAPKTGSAITVEVRDPKKSKAVESEEVLDAAIDKQASEKLKTHSKGRLSRHFGRQSRPMTSSANVTSGKTPRPFSSSPFMRRSIAGAESNSMSTSAKGVRKASDGKVVAAEKNTSVAGSRRFLRTSLPNGRGQRATSTPLRERVGGVDGMSARLPRVAELSGGEGDKKLSRPRLQRGSTFTGTVPGSTGRGNGPRVGGKVEESGGGGSASGMARILLSPSSSTASTPAKEVPKTPMLRRTMSFSHSRRGTSSGSNSTGARSPSPRPPFGSSSGRSGVERRSESPGTGVVKRFDRRATTSVTGSAGKPPRSGGAGFKATVPRPFDLVGLEMHEKMKREIEERRKRIHESEQRRRAFKARPMPDFSKPSPRPKRNQGGT